MKRYTLNDGHTIPALGLGTWKTDDPDEAVAAVKEALRVGYRHIDGAWIYQNEQHVGRAIRESIDEGVVRREELFVTSKLWNCFHAPEDVEGALRQTLDALGLDYLDLYLMHWPVAFPKDEVLPRPDRILPLSERPVGATFEAMAALVEKGVVRSVGVSNFGPARLGRLIEEGGRTPAVNQVELHPYNPQPELLDYCRDAGVHLTAYSPLGSMDRPPRMKADNEPPLLLSEEVEAAAGAEGLTPAQLLIAWAVARGTSVIPKSANPGRIAENFAAGSHELSADAKRAVDAIATRFRYVQIDAWAIEGVTFEPGSSFWA